MAVVVAVGIVVSLIGDGCTVRILSIRKGVNDGEQSTKTDDDDRQERARISRSDRNFEAANPKKITFIHLLTDPSHKRQLSERNRNEQTQKCTQRKQER